MPMLSTWLPLNNNQKGKRNKKNKWKQNQTKSNLVTNCLCEKSSRDKQWDCLCFRLETRIIKNE